MFVKWDVRSVKTLSKKFRKEKAWLLKSARGGVFNKKGADTQRRGEGGFSQDCLEHSERRKYGH